LEVIILDNKTEDDAGGRQRSMGRMYYPGAKPEIYDFNYHYY